uniref:Sec-Y independent transporter protein n=1 Tax=Proschkinia sp. SZCZR1824 TaxID=2588390 RepID=A0A4Y5SE09_9STRA|nr:Sec-Y independent transporter protein [Proschkinia sp. SZCZR1824]
MVNYFFELKNRLLLLLITFFSVFFTSYFYKEILLFLFFESELLTDYFIFTDVSEIFLVYLELCGFFSVHFTLMAASYQIFNFSTYGLFISEYKYLKLVFKVAFILWCLSLILSKLILIPMMFKFFFNFKTFSLLNVHFEARLNQYFIFYKQLYNSFVFYSQLLVLIIFYFSYLNKQKIAIKKYRKIFHYSGLFLATLCTPPDLISQLILSFFLIFFYEFFILGLIFKICYKNKFLSNKNT